MKINIGKLALAVFLCLAAGGIGSLFTRPAVTNWYVTLEKPFFSPPNWLFAPVWTVLFLLMGVSLYLVLVSSKPKKPAIAVFAIQLVLNVFWSVLFFGLRTPFFAMFEIIVLWAAIAITIKKFYEVDKTAAMLLLPYLVWVSFATVLNFAIWLLNH